MRPSSSLDESVAKAERMGFTVIAAPMVELRPIRCPEFERFVASHSVKAWDYVVFTSANGVAYAFDCADGKIETASLRRRLSHSQVVAIGPKTQHALKKLGVKVSHVPERYSSAGLLHLFAKLRPAGKTVGIIRSNHGSRELVHELTKLGARVVDLRIYEMALPRDTLAAEELLRCAAEGEIDVFCFTSSMTAKNFFSMAENKMLKKQILSQMEHSKVAAIGKPTAVTLKGEGVESVIVPKEETFESMLEAVRKRTS
jgi:uroporphyrinogen-III synthase